jgi:hypothetical protein
VRLSTLLAGGTALLLLVGVLAAVLDLGTGIDASLGTHAAIAIFFLTVLAVIAAGRMRDDGLLLLLAAASLLTYGQSMVLLLWDFTSFTLYHLRAPSPGEFARAVWWATGSTLLLAGGIVLGGGGRVAAAARDAPGARPLLLRAFTFVVASALVVLLLGLALTALFGVGTAGTETGRLAALANLFNRDMMLMLVLIATARHWRRLSHGRRAGALAVFGLYLLLSVYQGSRGGLILILVMALVTFVAQLGDFHLSRRLLTYLALTGVATGRRDLAARDANPHRARRQRRSRQRPGPDRDQRAAGECRSGNAIGVLHPILQRQGRMPQLIGVSNDWVPGARQQVAATGMVLNAIAGLAPGLNPDPLVYPLIGRAYAIIFLNSPREQIFAEEWSPAALALFFAPAPVAALFLVAWGALLAVTWRTVSRRSGDFAAMLAILFLYNLGFMLLVSAVPDILVPQFIRWVVLGGGLLVGYQVLERISMRSPARALRPALDVTHPTA